MVEGVGFEIWKSLVTMSNSTSTQMPNQIASKKPDISREQHSKQANIRQGKL